MFRRILTTKTGKQGHLFFTPWNDFVYLFWDKWPFKFKFEKFHAIIPGSAIYHPRKFLFFYLGNQFISVHYPRKFWIFIWESIYLSPTILAIQPAIWIFEANTNTITIIINLRSLGPNVWVLVSLFDADDVYFLVPSYISHILDMSL